MEYGITDLPDYREDRQMLSSAEKLEDSARDRKKKQLAQSMELDSINERCRKAVDRRKRVQGMDRGSNDSGRE